MHEQEVVTVVFQSKVVAYTCTHGNSRYASISDERIDLLVFGQEEVHELDKEHTTGRCYHEGAGTHDEYKEGVER